LSWGLSNTANAGAHFGGCNFLSAGRAGDAGSSRLWTQADGFYSAQSGNVSVEKPNSVGTYAPATWATKCQDAGGTAVSTATSSGSRVVFAHGTGTVDPAANTASIHWTGSFTSVFYGGLIYWSATNPALTVRADGTATLTASLTGYGASMTDPGVWTALPATTVTLANLSGVSVTPTGFTVLPAGAFPQSFVDFQQLTGEGPYWYSSGSSDQDKRALPLTVAYPTVLVAPATSAVVTSAPTTVSTPASVTSATTTPATSTPAPTASSAATSCDVTNGVRGGALTWGFKKSFRAYIAGGGAANTIGATNGATILNQNLAVAGKSTTGEYLWPFVSSAGYTSATSFTVQYGGSVQFSYPAHFFSIVIANPRLVVDGASGTLFADVTVTATNPGVAPVVTPHLGVALATLDLTGSAATSSAAGTTRAMHAAIQDSSAFSLDGSAFYQAGEALDDATVLLSGCAGVTAPSGSTTDASTSSAVDAATDDLVPSLQYRPGELANTGSEVSGLLAAGIAALLIGGLLMVGARRTGGQR
jgi:LPXTG-motif cell wall-anchored protein